MLSLPQFVEILTVCVVLEGRHLLDGHLCVGDCVHGRGRCLAPVDQRGFELGDALLDLDLHLDEGVGVETHVGLVMGSESHRERYRRSGGGFNPVNQVGVKLHVQLGGPCQSLYTLHAIFTL